MLGAGSAHDGEGGTPNPPAGLGPEEARTPCEAKAAGVAVERRLGLALDTGSFSTVT